MERWGWRTLSAARANAPLDAAIGQVTIDIRLLAEGRIRRAFVPCSGGVVRLRNDRVRHDRTADEGRADENLVADILALIVRVVLVRFVVLVVFVALVMVPEVMPVVPVVAFAVAVGMAAMLVTIAMPTVMRLVGTVVRLEPMMALAGMVIVSLVLVTGLNRHGRKDETQGDKTDHQYLLHLSVLLTNVAFLCVTNKHIIECKSAFTRLDELYGGRAPGIPKKYLPGPRAAHSRTSQYLATCGSRSDGRA